MVPLVLDSAGLDALVQPWPPVKLRALFAEALARRRDVLVPAVVCAEVCRGTARTRRVEAALGRHGRTPESRSAVTVVPTDLSLAKQVGAILHGVGADSCDMADAHVVAVCVSSGGGLVVTTDPADVHRLAESVPNVRIGTRAPD